MSRTMYDAVTASNVPAGATLVAGYGDGYYANIGAFKARFPHATVVEIAVSAQHDLGVVLDVETGDAKPDEAPGWVRTRRAAGVDPTVYCNASTWPSVRAAFRAAGVPEPHYWIAEYNGDPTIPVGAVAKQYADPGPYDLSNVAPFWPGVDSSPSEADVPLTPADVQAIWNYSETDAATGKPVRFGAVMAWMDKVHADQEASITALKTELDAVKAELDGVKAQLASVSTPQLNDAQIAALAQQLAPVLAPALAPAIVQAMGHALDGTKP